MIVLIDSIKNPIARYCSYQERSQKEVSQKLLKLQCVEEEIPHYIAWLIEENFINEERFASAYVRGKFNLKKWGKQKIIKGLKQHQISDYLQKSAISEISEQDYRTTATKLIEAKMKQLKKKKLDFVSEQKVYTYMYHKGYEADIIKSITQHYR